MGVLVRRRFELIGGNSSKFWEIEIEGSSVTTWWGRIGTAGQSRSKDFGSPARAVAEQEKLITEKVSKGYIELVPTPSAQKKRMTAKN
ncbi:MAG: WGR domain-containing protein, partial [Terriglobales bacterium]